MSTVRLVTCACGVLVLVCGAAVAEESPPEKGVLLMGTISDWLYPGCAFHGAESSDAAVRDITSIKSKTLLSTPDPADQVVAFYCKLLKVDRQGRNLGEQPGERLTTKRSVSIQDDSSGRPLELTIIAIDESDVSTTLVISRAEGEETTHIAWSQYRKIAP